MQLYEPIEPKRNYYQLGCFIFLFIIIGYLLFRFVYARKNEWFPSRTINSIKDSIKQSQPDIHNNDIFFSDVEMSTLLFLINQIEINGYSTIDDLHNKLGVSNKSIEIQKKIRNEFIININAKYKEIFKSDDVLIYREKDENDKRSFKYIITKENSQLIKELNNGSIL